MGVTLRAVGEGDRDAIWRLLEPVFREGRTYAIDTDISREDALAYWLGGRAAFVAEIGGDAIGTYYIRRNQAGGGAHVCNAGFITARATEGRGVAGAMLSHALGAARELGFAAMQFNFVLANNVRAVALWQREGFEIVGTVPRAFDHPDDGYVDALIMHRFL